jgi:hypothetical protein
MDVRHPLFVPDDPDLLFKTGKDHPSPSLKIVQAGEQQKDRQNEDNSRSRNPFDPSHDSTPVIERRLPMFNTDTF